MAQWHKAFTWTNGMILGVQPANECVFGGVCVCHWYSLTTKTLAFWGYLMIIQTIDSYRIPSQNKTTSQLQI